jgi:response regulator RpfG family c-di-GMP phosphodiesterase
LLAGSRSALEQVARSPTLRQEFDPSVVSAFLSEAETFRAIAQRFQDE